MMIDTGRARKNFSYPGLPAYLGLRIVKNVR